MSTQRERDEAKREQKLREIDDQLESGSLTIRPMTSAEREKFPAKERPPSRPRKPFRRAS
jgi:hypothetical protein